MTKKGAAQQSAAAEDESFYRGVRELLAELPIGNDLEIITLKGHLVIEQLLVQAMESTAVNSAPIKKLNRLQYSTRVAIVESMTKPSERGREIWPLVKKLGAIRNKLAHQLKPEKLDEDIKHFIGLYIDYFGAKVKPPVSDANRKYVTSTNILIPQNVRTGSDVEKYRNAIAGTAQGLTGLVSVVRDNAKVASRAVQRARTRS